MFLFTACWNVKNTFSSIYFSSILNVKIEFFMSFHESHWTGDGKDSSPDTERVVTRIDTPKYGETLKFMYIKYQPILAVLPKVYQV